MCVQGYFIKVSICLVPMKVWLKSQGSIFAEILVLFVPFYGLSSECIIVSWNAATSSAEPILDFCIRSRSCSQRRVWLNNHSQLLANNDLRGLDFLCNTALDASGTCICTYPPSATTKLIGQCVVSGQDVLDAGDTRFCILSLLITSIVPWNRRHPNRGLRWYPCWYRSVISYCVSAFDWAPWSWLIWYRLYFILRFIRWYLFT